MKYNSQHHPKVRNQSDDFIDNLYPVYLMTEINIEFNGGIKFHRQYNDVISQLQTLSGSDKTYGARLFLYMVNLAKHRNNHGFRVCLDKSLFVDKGKDSISYQSWVDMLETAVAYGYGKLYVGDSSNEKVLSHYVSVFELKPKAFDLLDGMNQAKSPNVKLKQNKKESLQCTIKFTKDHEEPIQNLRGTRPYKNALNKFNEFLLTHEFKTEQGVVFDPQMSRKFSLYADNAKNEGRTIWESYGRYTNVAQSLSQEQRAAITIDNEPVCELDYSSNHAFICYELEGICKYDFKPYHIDDCDSPLTVSNPKAKRAVYKLAMMMLFNSNNATTSLHNHLTQLFATIAKYKANNRTITKKLQPFLSFDECPSISDCSKVVMLLKQRNSEISDHFKGCAAPKLQNYDSRIAEQIMLELMNQDIPFICIHDSFIVPRRNKKALYKAMFNGWDYVLGNRDNCHVDAKPEAKAKPAITPILEEINQAPAHLTHEQLNMFVFDVGNVGTDATESTHSDSKPVSDTTAPLNKENAVECDTRPISKPLWCANHDISDHEITAFIHGRIESPKRFIELACIWQDSGKQLTQFMQENQYQLGIDEIKPLPKFIDNRSSPLWKTH